MDQLHLQSLDVRLTSFRSWLRDESEHVSYEGIKETAKDMKPSEDTICPWFRVWVHKKHFSKETGIIFNSVKLRWNYTDGHLNIRTDGENAQTLIFLSKNLVLVSKIPENSGEKRTIVILNDINKIRVEKEW